MFFALLISLIKLIANNSEVMLSMWMEFSDIPNKKISENMR